MGSIILLIIVIIIASQLDKWQSTKNIKGKMSLDEIDDLFNEKSNEERK